MGKNKFEKEVLLQAYKDLRHTSKQAKKRGDLEAQLQASALLIELHGRIADLKGDHSLGFIGGEISPEEV